MSESQYVIQKNVPIVRVNPSKHTNLFETIEKMEIGDSLVVEGDGARASALQYSKRTLKYKLVTRRVSRSEAGSPKILYRVWRIA